MAKMDPDLRNDVRWQLIERIAAGDPFQKSTRLRELLDFIADRSLRNDTQSLGGHQIGIAVFGKLEDYEVSEDVGMPVRFERNGWLCPR